MTRLIEISSKFLVPSKSLRNVIIIFRVISYHRNLIEICRLVSVDRNLIEIPHFIEISSKFLVSPRFVSFYQNLIKTSRLILIKSNRNIIWISGLVSTRQKLTEIARHVSSHRNMKKNLISSYLIEILCLIEIFPKSDRNCSSGLIKISSKFRLLSHRNLIERSFKRFASSRHIELSLKSYRNFLSHQNFIKISYTFLVLSQLIEISSKSHHDYSSRLVWLKSHR